MSVLAGLATLVRSWRGDAARVLVSGEPDVVLLSSAAALRRLGARITRYDVETGTPEARLASGLATLRLRATAADERTTRVELEGDAGARHVVRRFRAALAS